MYNPTGLTVSPDPLGVRHFENVRAKFEEITVGYTISITEFHDSLRTRRTLELEAIHYSDPSSHGRLKVTW